MLAAELESAHLVLMYNVCIQDEIYDKQVTRAYWLYDVYK